MNSPNNDKRSIEPVQPKSSKLSLWKQKLEKHSIAPSGKKARETKSNPLNSLMARISEKKKLLYILLDTSGSMMGEKLDLAKAGARDFIHHAKRKGYRVGLISFSCQGQLRAKANINVNAVLEELSCLSASGSTDLSGALKIAHTLLSSQHGQRVVWVVTDVYSDSAVGALYEGDRIKSDGIDIICLGTEDADHAFLRKLASREDLAKETTSSELGVAMKKMGEQLPTKGSVLQLEAPKEDR